MKLDFILDPLSSLRYFGLTQQISFVRFKKHLRNQQKLQEKLDIRQYILSLTQEPVSFGFNDYELEHYSHNIFNIFPNGISIDEEKKWLANNIFLALGTVYPDEKISDQHASRIFKTIPKRKTKLLIEQCFLASAGSWAECFDDKNSNYACLGYFYDDLAHYFMANNPNRLIERLNSDHELESMQIKRAKGNLNKIVTEKVSKYNSQPISPIDFSTKYNRRVLVCDQTFPDASVQYGKADQTNFENMLKSAIRENPDAEIIVKLHPDTHWDKERKSGYLDRINGGSQIKILREPINPFVIFDHVDTVYVVTSHLGLEALFAKKKVICFGSPFYAGWGLTDDRQKTPHRARNRTLVELFYFTYIWYTIYNVPNIHGVAEIEDAIDFILKTRPV